ncbi:copper chaperone PCu(A)C [Streptomyces sp. NPDC054796]
MSTADPVTPVRRLPALAGASALALTLALALTGCAAEAKPELKVSGAYMPQPVTDTMAGGFLTVTNSGDEADKLTSVSSDVAKEAEIHRTVGQKMERVKSLKVPANGELRLGRGGNHLMFLGLEHKPAKGEKVSVTLRFEKSGAMKVSVPVESTNYVPDGTTGKSSGESSGK